MEGFVQMFQKKTRASNLLAFFVFVSIQTFANDLFEGESGEIISIPAAVQENSDVLTFKTFSGTKQLVSLPFVKQDLMITRHHVNIKSFDEMLLIALAEIYLASYFFCQKINLRQSYFQSF